MRPPNRLGSAVAAAASAFAGPASAATARDSACGGGVFAQTDNTAGNRVVAYHSGDGTLTSIGSVTVPGAAGGEGIAAA